MIDLSKAVDYANRNWFRPCEDGAVWNASTPIKPADEARKRGLSPDKWSGLFIFYDSKDGRLAEGLFLVPQAEAFLSTLAVRGHLSKNFPNKHFLCSWSDKEKESTEGQTPPYTGLNDCTHFTSQCLVAGGLPVGSIEANEFVGKLRARSDVKTLCLKVGKEQARRIINDGPLTPGDVVAFSSGGKFHHAILYLGNRKVAAHTHCNHPSGPSFNLKAEPDKGVNNWEVSANTSHPDVTLLHFTFADLDRSHLSWAVGWWEMFWRGQTYYYHLAASGAAAWTDSPPADLTRQPASPGGRGYWFATPTHGVQICWRDTGTFEALTRIPVVGTLVGVSNDEAIGGSRLGP